MGLIGLPVACSEGLRGMLGQLTKSIDDPSMVQMMEPEGGSTFWILPGVWEAGFKI